jgi:hypothetical protein
MRDKIRNAVDSRGSPAIVWGMRSTHSEFSKVRHSGFRAPGFFRGVMLAALAVVMAAPALVAGGADGIYRPTKVSGNFVANGRQVSIPSDVLREALLRNGRIVIRDNQMRIFRSQWQDLLEEFNYLGLDGEVSATGPARLVFRPGDGGFTGRTATPFQLRLDADLLFRDVSIRMRANLRGRVEGDTLTLTAPVTLEGFGLVGARGTITLKAER